MNKVALILLTTLAATSLGAQNKVRNSSFESGTCTPDNYLNSSPNASAGQTFNNCLFDWENLGTKTPSSHSPDWYRNNMFGGAQDGDRFVHMVNYEGIQQKMSSELVNGEYYFISVWVHLNSMYLGTRDFSSAALNIYFAGSGLLGNSRIEYADDPGTGGSQSGAVVCEPDYRKLNGNDISLAKQIDLSGFPLDEWVQIQFIYPYNGLAKRDIIAFELIDKNADSKVVGCDKSSICLDNIEITNSYCSHPCAGNKSIPIESQWAESHNNQLVEYYGPIEDGIFQVVTNAAPGIVSLRGANYVKLIVENSFGETDSWEYFNPNGLSNADYITAGMLPGSFRSFVENRPDLFTLMWDGTINGNLYPVEEVYTIRIIVKGCGIGSYEDVFSVVLSGIADQPAFLPIFQNNQILRNDCCKEGSITVYGNNTPSLFYQDFIEVKDGFNLVSAEDALHVAGTYIELSEGVSFDYGSQYSAYIKACSTPPNKADSEFTEKLKLISKTSSFSETKVFPNPSKDDVTIINGGTKIQSVTFYNFLGDVVLNQLTEGLHVMELNISFLKPGLYILEIKLESGQVETQIVTKI